MKKTGLTFFNDLIQIEYKLNTYSGMNAHKIGNLLSRVSLLKDIIKKKHNKIRTKKIYNNIKNLKVEVNSFI